MIGRGAVQRAKLTSGDCLPACLPAAALLRPESKRRAGASDRDRAGATRCRGLQRAWGPCSGALEEASGERAGLQREPQRACFSPAKLRRAKARLCDSVCLNFLSQEVWLNCRAGPPRAWCCLGQPPTPTLSTRVVWL